MAADKTTKRRQRVAKDDASGTGGPTKGWLRVRSDPRQESRYEPVGSAAAWISMLGMSLGAVALGAGVYGQWLRSSVQPEMTEPHPYAVYLLVGAALVLAAVALFGPRQVKPIRVGDAGIAVEKDPGDLERIQWRDVTRIVIGGDVVTFQSPGTVLAIPVKLHPQAAARAVAEARRRIPGKMEDVDTSSVPKVEDDLGEVLPLERAQLAGGRCKASDELIAFEKDARLCGRCGEVYHKAHVPDACLTCEAPLK
jgi:hypothetical protein